MCIAARRAHFVDLEAAQDQRRGERAGGVEQQRQRRADRLDQQAGQPRPGDLGARTGERVLRVRLDQPVAREARAAIPRTIYER